MKFIFTKRNVANALIVNQFNNESRISRFNIYIDESFERCSPNFHSPSKLVISETNNPTKKKLIHR